MPTFNMSFLNEEFRQLNTYTDEESGCRVYEDRQAFELCKQSYYLKKQTVNTQPTNNNDETNQEIESLKIDNAKLQMKIETIEKQQDTMKSYMYKVITLDYLTISFIVLFSIIFITMFIKWLINFYKKYVKNNR